MAPRITNVAARKYVQRKESFQGNNKCLVNGGMAGTS
jgi:hypothetical protein